MAFLRPQNAKLELTESINSDPPSLSPSAPFTILDQIKRSAGHTPAKKKSRAPKGFPDTMRHSDNADGRFATGCRLSMSESISLDDVVQPLSNFSLFQASSSHTTKFDSSKLFANNGETNLRGSCGGDVYDDSWTRRPFVSASGSISMDQRELDCWPATAPEGPADRTLRVLDSHLHLATTEVETMQRHVVPSPLHALDSPSVSSSSSSSSSNNTYDASWGEENSGDDHQVLRPSSMFDRTEEEDGTTVLGGTDDEGLDSDDDEDDESLMHDTSNPITAVESFLDELAEIDGMHQLGTLLLQVGSCTLTGDDGDDDDDEADDFTADADAISPSPQGRRRRRRGKKQQQQQQKRGRSPPSPSRSFPVVSAAESLLDGAGSAADSLSQIFSSLSLQTDSLLEIMGNKTNDGEPPPPTTPDNSNRTFLQSLFSCH